MLYREGTRIPLGLTDAEVKLHYGSPPRVPELVPRALRAGPDGQGRVRVAWGGCSTCRRNMTIVSHGSLETRRTRGHFRPRLNERSSTLPGALRHDPTLPHRPVRAWAYQCHQCNSDQGPFTLRQWHHWLGRSGDPRAITVRMLMRHLLKRGLSENDF